MYYSLEQSLTDVQADHLEIDRCDTTPYFRWLEGRRFRLPPTSALPVKIRSAYGIGLPDFCQFEFPLVSSRLLRAFIDAGVDNLDAYPLALSDAEMLDTRDEYFAVNVIGVVSCADMAASHFSEANELSRFSVSFVDLVIDPERCRGQLLFRLYECLPVVVVHELVVSRILAQEWTGIRFRELRIGEQG